MADFVFNTALGRGREFYDRVNNNDPSTSRLLVAVLALSGLEADSVLKDKDTLADLLSGTTNEVTNTNYARKFLTDTDLAASAPDDAGDRLDLDIIDIVWNDTAPHPSAGDVWAKMVVCYDPNAGGGDAAVIPITCHDMPVTPDGTQITGEIDPLGFYGAS